MAARKLRTHTSRALARRKSPQSIKGILKGLRISEREIERAKKSLFKNAR